MDALVPAPSDAPAAAVQSAPPAPSGRLVSLDAYRGFIMLVLSASAFGVVPGLLLKFYPNSPAWQGMVHHLVLQWDHVGYAISSVADFRFWDLIQPAFMFIVGVSVPFSYAARRARGQGFVRMFGHAAYRALLLILLGVFLRSGWSGQTVWTFEDVVSQIGLGYIFLFLLWNLPWPGQAVAAVGILVGYWALWQYWPQFAWLLGVKQAAVAGWPKIGNPGQAFDVWLRNWLPHNKPFVNHEYYTLNFIPALANMIFGLMAGELLGSKLPARHKLLILVATGIAGIILGVLLGLGASPVCPIIKKIWTPSFAIFSGGWTLLLLAAFYGVVDVLGWRRWTFPAVVLGVNSVAVYVLMWLWPGWLTPNVNRHVGFWLFAGMSPPWVAVVRSLLVFAIFWLVFFWMYRRRIFLRI
ncbi:MAG: DUF5009 domain-containing protein [Planctomycetes bacterium]|nr:DUF5009 domain-containing protein [Planctomycetota bacterium]